MSHTPYQTWTEWSLYVCLLGTLFLIGCGESPIHNEYVYVSDCRTLDEMSMNKKESCPITTYVRLSWDGDTVQIRRRQEFTNGDVRIGPNQDLTNGKDDYRCDMWDRHNRTCSYKSTQVSQTVSMKNGVYSELYEGSGFQSQSRVFTSKIVMNVLGHRFTVWTE